MPARELLDVVAIGGGQAGLAMVRYLARQRLRFVVLDAGPELGPSRPTAPSSCKVPDSAQL